ncbi:putative development/cell death domain, kelch-type beta propeller containing protein, partial [Tanacetum coccineum]
SFERHDPREEAWEKLTSMKTKKGCHSMVILNEKLMIGGFDGEKYVPAIECFDTRMGSWVEAEPMNISRGNFGAFVLDEKLYTIGGVKENEVVMDIVECFKEGSCWEIVDLKAIGKRSTKS